MAADTRNDQMPIIMLVDGDCALCHGMTKFAVQRDKHQRFRIAALQSEIGSKLLTHAGLDAQKLDSLVLLEHGRVYVKSGAALRVFRRLGGLWPLLYATIVLPAPIRDYGYSWIARMRYRMFGQADICMLPTAAGRQRFIEDNEPLDHLIKPKRKS
ncbi:thiol-disulfide oxidoreductase [Paenibacillus sp. CCS19]|uniref:thiol-disulfide oxidoreductase DCC family protein n=1 Tax=Paenibacillus sp. CCS19 TaxID=3158387 RepID=UPI00256C081F|nr:DCC1-like thiol-disulfide oxidoreductase family protein [Paenibacillus cellulosilyticus]GMK37122.1 thiol-disulfide oxidoreductase [Paenibacillus cellulosilyticus]